MEEGVAEAERVRVLCPLCGSDEVARIETLRSRDLIGLYRKALQVDVRREFSGTDEIAVLNCRGCDLRFFWPAVTGTEDFYEQLQEFSWYYAGDRQEYDFARQFIGAADHVLEVGCGEGKFAEALSCGGYWGLEFNPAAAGKAQAKGLRVSKDPVEVFSREHEGEFDAVCCLQVMEHVSDPRSFIRSCFDCLRPGGLFISSTPGHDTFVSIATNNILNMPPHHVTWWSDACLKNIATLFGVEMRTLHHEKVAADHKEWYLATLVEASLRDALGMAPSRLDTSLPGRFCRRVSRSAARFLARGFAEARMLPPGHSVTCVYEKTGSSNGQR